MEVGGANDGAQVEFVSLHLHRRLKFVNVLARVVGGNDCKAVEVGQQLSNHHGGERRDARLSAEQRVGGARDDAKHDNTIGQQALGEINRHAELALRHALYGTQHTGGVLPQVRPVLLRLLQPAVLSLGRVPFLQLLQRVRGVVVPLPDEEERQHLRHAQEVGHAHVFLRAHCVLQVALHKVGVPALAQLVVVQVVVLHIPRLRLHPVQPVVHAALEAKGKGAAVEAAGDLAVLALLRVVATVAHVVTHHRPAAHDGRGDGDGGKHGEGRHDEASPP
mmetsp:Transcript_34207/g.87476  ORF Transcript_34207/g.87476 Transcript_34207/m.87476 type:complete len:277 (+) Transcript_34207:488-1318(+)